LSSRDSRKSNLRELHGHDKLDLEFSSKISLVRADSQAVVLARDVSVWDLNEGSLLAIFTPDFLVQGYALGLGGQLVLLGFADSPELATLQLVSQKTNAIELVGENIFDESESSDDDNDTGFAESKHDVDDDN